MKYLLTVLLCLLIICEVSCKNKKVVNAQINNGNNENIDITTMATPNGGKLKSAENGPVRSALGQPNIDLNTFTLEITGLVDSSFSLSWEQINNLPAVFSDTIIMYCVEG